MLQSRRSSITQQPQLIRSISFDWTNRVRRLSSLRSFNTSQTPSPADPNSLFNFSLDMTSPIPSLLLTPSTENTFNFGSKPSRIPAITPSSEWSEFLMSGGRGVGEKEIGPLEKKAVVPLVVRNPSISKMFPQNPQDWKAMLGEYDIVSESSDGNSLSSTRSTGNDLPSTPQISPTLPDQLLSPLQISSSHLISPASFIPVTRSYNRNPPETLGYGNSLSTFQYNQPPPPLLSLPPAIQSRLSADKSRRAKDIEPITHSMITRKASVDVGGAKIVDESEKVISKGGGGALHWLGMAEEDRELHNKSGAEKKLTAIRIVKPSKRKPKAAQDEEAMANARNKSSARKLARKPVGYTPRPPNAWILYRSEQIKILKTDKDVSKKPQSDISKLIGYMWREEPAEVKKSYEALAETAKAEHALKYPGYRFKPIRRRDKSLSPFDDEFTSQVIPFIPYQTHFNSPHKTRASTSINNGPFSTAQYSSNSQPSAQPQNSQYAPQPPPFYPSTYETLNYSGYQPSTGTPAFYFAANSMPTPPNSAAYPYSPLKMSPEISVDPNVAAFLASLSADSTGNYLPIPSQTVFDAQNYSNYNAAQEASVAWNEFENSAKWFPSPPPDGGFIPVPMSAPAAISTFTTSYTHTTPYLPYGIPHHRSSLGSNNVYIDRAPRSVKPDTWVPTGAFSQSPTPVSYLDINNAESVIMDTTQ